MKHITYTELRQNLAPVMDEVCDSHAPILVTRRNGRSVVVLPEDEYESMLETLHLLRTPLNAAWLLDSIAQADAGAIVDRGIVE
jgi:antitoxin YefM